MTAPAAWRGSLTVAPAKVNATLVVGPVRPDDGRHELVSAMQSVSLADEVVLRPRGADGAADVTGTSPDGDSISCPGVGDDNLALRALHEFRTATGWDAGPLHVDVVKRIPVAAGMAGGSADAGAVLRLAAHASGRGDADLLQELAAGLGADVPHQLRPGLALATGAGERLRRFPGGLPGAVLIVLSADALSTPAVYRRADELRAPCTAETLKAWHFQVETALTEPAGPTLPEALAVNDLQDAATELSPGLGATLDGIEATGAERVMVCGSGPTAIGWFPDAAAAEQAAARLRDGGADVRVAVPVDAAPIVPLPESPA